MKIVGIVDIAIDNYLMPYKFLIRNANQLYRQVEMIEIKQNMPESNRTSVNQIEHGDGRFRNNRTRSV